MDACPRTRPGCDRCLPGRQWVKAESAHHLWAYLRLPFPSQAIHYLCHLAHTILHQGRDLPRESTTRTIFLRVSPKLNLLQRDKDFESASYDTSPLSTTQTSSSLHSRRAQHGASPDHALKPALNLTQTHYCPLLVVRCPCSHP